MADALRQLLAEFVVEVDKAGALKRGNVEVEALKDRLHELQTIMQTIRTPAAKAAKTVQDVFARAAQQAQTNLAAIQARTLGAGGGTGDQSGGFAAAGAAASLRQAKAAADAAANSIGNRFRLALSRAGAGVRGFVGRISGGGGSLLGGLTSLRAGLIGLATGVIASFTTRMLDSIGGIGEAAAKLGVTNAEFQRLDVLAKQNATSVEALGTGFRTLARNVVQPTKESADALRSIGVEAKNADGSFKGRQDLFFEVAGALADVGDETRRAGLATILLGRSGEALLPILANGRAGLEAQREALMKMSVVSDDAIKKADEFGDNLEILKREMMAGLAPVLVGLIPVFKVIGQSLSTIVRAFSQLGQSAAGAGALKLALTALMAPLLAIEDFIVFLAGGKSVLGKALEGAFGTDSPVLKTVKAFFEGIFGGFGALIDFLNGETSFEEFGDRFLQVTADMTEAIDDWVDHVISKIPVVSGIFDFASKVSEGNFGGAALSLARNVTGTDAGTLESTGGILSSIGNALNFAPAIDPGGVTGFGGPSIQDNSTKQYVVHVNSTAEVEGAMTGMQRASGRDAQANLSAVAP